MNDYCIRFATEKDISSLLPLLAELGYPTSYEQLKVRFNKFLCSPGYGIAVGEKSGLILGFIAWSRSSLFVSDATRFHIEGLVVNSSYRSEGVGRKLMTFVEDIAKQSSPSIIDLTSGLRRAQDGSHEFYKNLGYKNEGSLAKLYLRKKF